ncbi:MerR family transcriptional regulator [Listeria cossartiae subsp. cayugensis]|uniref:MerR family transcriptional regulator n=2 Tax=Listeria TaxID=1637 RepID=A0A7X0ZDU3_9LIST|nr:MerR family transcriptional regulator [Listeria cossartiae]MBC2250418.1 MerR family transcriptional regulator [Listeria cossartiae subsp. cayugensis]MDT0000934.1 MerR family transcriptional regulator [Listeria cossartiae subsp. cayugensis]MDT0008962.1 MerR family transcriptional regulator [Listeria cossartiae subsp. cayugensis]MDT0030794.1 MerR family transcriptional regulator [Listeria cossartiae subsp. cayugensis]MDT0038909.1 MerR family transcriptional regulator [Listeria cossartiae subs
MSKNETVLFAVDASEELTMNIKEASEKSGVSADTIRYYERIGLIPPVHRNENGVRKFGAEDLRWIQFSRQMRRAGLSIEALIDYLALFREGEHTLEARAELLKEQRIDLKNRIDVMQDALDRLDFKIDNYDTHLIPAQQKLKDF